MNAGVANPTWKTVNIKLFSLLMKWASHASIPMRKEHFFVLEGLWLCKHLFYGLLNSRGCSWSLFKIMALLDLFSLGTFQHWGLEEDLPHCCHACMWCMEVHVTTAAVKDLLWVCMGISALASMDGEVTRCAVSHSAQQVSGNLRARTAMLLILF